MNDTELRERLNIIDDRIKLLVEKLTAMHEHSISAQKLGVEHLRDVIVTARFGDEAVQRLNGAK